jgi:hypothetical protein
LLLVVIERLFIDTIPVQHEGLQQVLRQVRPDVVIGDDCFLGLLPMLLGRRSNRPPVVCFGTSILHWPRQDGAPAFLGLTPATTQVQREEYEGIKLEYDKVVNQPLMCRLNHCLKSLGKGPLSTPPFEAQVKLADAYLQLTVPSFEFSRILPDSVRFVGTLPITPNQAPLPPWNDELDGTRKVVLVSQGTVANHDSTSWSGRPLRRWPISSTCS